MIGERGNPTQAGPGVVLLPQPRAEKAPRRSHLRRGLSLSALAFALTACGQAQVEMEEMSSEITAALETAPSAEVEAQRMAVDLSGGFEPALRAAVKANEGYRAALRLEEEATSRIGVAASVRRPQISGNANLGGIRETGGTQPDDTRTGVAAGINVSQLIYDAGASTAAVNSATAQALAARAERQALGNELALEAARAWIDVWQFEARLGLLRRRTTEMDGLITQLERMAASGIVDRAAMNSARRQVVDITLEETQLQSQLDAARVGFERLFNRAGGDVGQPEALLRMAQAEAMAETWQNAPGLQRTAAQMVVAQNAVTQARAAFRPTARLQAGVNSPMEESEGTNTTVGLLVEYKFGDGGRRQAELASAEARAEAAEEQLTEAQRTLQAELAAALTQLRSIEQSMPQVAEQIRLSASEAQTSRSQITTGQSNLRQLVEVELENYRAQDRQIAMRAERQIVLLTMAARTGELSRRLGLVAEPAR
jgi:outer membrane protein TolC